MAVYDYDTWCRLEVQCTNGDIAVRAVVMKLPPPNGRQVDQVDGPLTGSETVTATTSITLSDAQTRLSDCVNWQDLEGHDAYTVGSRFELRSSFGQFFVIAASSLGGELVAADEVEITAESGSGAPFTLGTAQQLLSDAHDRVVFTKNP